MKLTKSHEIYPPPCISDHACLGRLCGLAGADKDSMKGAMPSDMATRRQMMENRMEMMEATMQMMMDRLPPATAQ